MLFLNKKYFQKRRERYLAKQKLDWSQQPLCVNFCFRPTICQHSLLQTRLSKQSVTSLKSVSQNSLSADVRPQNISHHAYTKLLLSQDWKRHFNILKGLIAGGFFFIAFSPLVCYTAVFSVVTQRSSLLMAAENRTTFLSLCVCGLTNKPIMYKKSDNTWAAGR